MRCYLGQIDQGHNQRYVLKESCAICTDDRHDRDVFVELRASQGDGCLSDTSKNSTFQGFANVEPRLICLEDLDRVDDIQLLELCISFLEPLRDCVRSNEAILCEMLVKLQHLLRDTQTLSRRFGVAISNTFVEAMMLLVVLVHGATPV